MKANEADNWRVNDYIKGESVMTSRFFIDRTGFENLKDRRQASAYLKAQPTTDYIELRDRDALHLLACLDVPAMPIFVVQPDDLVRRATLFAKACQADVREFTRDGSDKRDAGIDADGIVKLASQIVGLFAAALAGQAKIGFLCGYSRKELGLMTRKAV